MPIAKKKKNLAAHEIELELLKSELQHKEDLWK